MGIGASYYPPVPHIAQLFTVRTFHSWPQALQRDFVSKVAGSPFSGLASIFFLPLNV
jgi:hypothetical protein